jgi:uncharacterized membrane protein YjgN (DUF898 family)
MVPWLIGAVCLALYAVSVRGIMQTQIPTGPDGKPDPQVAMQVVGNMMAAMMLLIPLMMAAAWYRGRRLAHFVASTRFHGHQLSSAITGFNYLWLGLSNALLVLFTFGLGVPFTYRRVLQFVERKVGLVGDGDFSALIQSTQDKPTWGEGLADAFDIGAI